MIMSVASVVALVVFCGAVGTYFLCLGLFPPVRTDRTEDVMRHNEHMKIRARYGAQQWQDWTGKQ